MSTASDLDEIIVNLKATIASNKGGVQLQNLESEFKCSACTTLEFIDFMLRDGRSFAADIAPI